MYKNTSEYITDVTAYEGMKEQNKENNLFLKSYISIIISKSRFIFLI